MTGRRVRALIERLAADPQPWRFEAEQELVQLGGPAIEPLLAALEEGGPSVRLHAVRALGRIGDLRALGPVVAALAETENLGAVAIAAEKVLVHWGEAAKPALLEAALSGPEGARPRALRALGALGGEELAAPLSPLLAHASPPIRLQAAVALGRALGAKATGLIAPLLSDPDVWVRYGVAEALVQLGSGLGDAVLRQAALAPEDDDEGVRAWAEALLERSDRDRNV